MHKIITAKSQNRTSDSELDEFQNRTPDIEYSKQVPFWIVTWRGQNFNEEKLSGGNQGKEVAVTTPNLDPWLPPLNVD